MFNEDDLLQSLLSVDTSNQQVVKLEQSDNTDLAYAKSHCGVISASKVYTLATYQPNADVMDALALEIDEITAKIDESKTGKTKTLSALLESKTKQYNRMFNDELPEGAIEWCKKLACMRETGFCEESDVSFESKETRWGKLNEPRAIAKLIEQYPATRFLNTLDNQKFIKLDGFEYVGATPDAIVIYDETNEDGYQPTKWVLDVKCPFNREIHLYGYGRIKNYEQFKRAYPMYYWQGVLQMMCAKVNKFMFASYDYRFESVGKDLFVYEFDLIQEDADFLRSRIEKAERLISEIMVGVK